MSNLKDATIWGAAAAALVLTSCNNTEGPPEAIIADLQPNIVVIVADDLGYADVSSYGGVRLQTPNIDRIAENGVIFTDGYSAAPVCAPARAGLQTGRYPDRFGFEFNNGPARRDAEMNLGIDPGERTIADELKALGYATSMVGKWHLGSNDDYYPMNRGYDEYVGLLNGATAYMSDDAPGAISAYPPGATTSFQDGRRPLTMIVEGRDKTVIDNEDEVYLTDFFGDRAVDAVARHAADQTPFFLYLAFTAPHDPLTTTQKYYDRFPEIEDEGYRVYASMVSALDENIGRVLDAIEASGENDNTIIYFMSDNGCAGYIQGICSCEPLRGTKLSHYEGGVRVPFMMRWPEKLDGGQVYRNVVSTMDVFSTSLVAAKGQLRDDRIYDGVNLIPYLTGADEGAPHDALMWRRTPMASIRKGDWKLWKSLDGEFTLLFNLADDLNETTNLTESEPEKLQELEADWEQWAADLQDPKWPSRPHTNFSVCGTPFELPI